MRHLRHAMTDVIALWYGMGLSLDAHMSSFLFALQAASGLPGMGAHGAIARLRQKYGPCPWLGAKRICSEEILALPRQPSLI